MAGAELDDGIDDRWGPIVNTWIVQMVSTRYAHRVAAWVFVVAVVAVIAGWHWVYHPSSLRIVGGLWLVVALALVIAIATDGLAAWRYMLDPGTHPVVERVISWGGDPAAVAIAAKQEFRSPRFRCTDGWSVTNQFLIQSTFFTFDILRLCDLLWAYRRFAWHALGTSSIFVIPLEGLCEAVLICEGGAAHIQGGKRETDAMLAFAAARAPWAFGGFSKALKKQLKADPAAFRLAVAQRRQEWQPAPAAASGSTALSGSDS